MENNVRKNTTKNPKSWECMKLRILNYYSSAIITQSKGQQSENKLETWPVSHKNETKQIFDTKFVSAPLYYEYLHLAFFGMG